MIHRSEIKKYMLSTIVLLAVCVGSIASTNRLEISILKTQQDIKVALSEINMVRSEIAEARSPLAEKHENLSRDVKAKRLVYERMVEAREYSEDHRLSLKKEVSHFEDECQFIFAALSEYRRGLTTRISIAESESIKNELDLCDEELRSKGITEIAEVARSILPFAVNLSLTGVGGSSVEGSAVNSEGIEESGQFLIVGPVSYFANTNDVGGIVINSSGGLLPSYFGEHSERDQDAIVELLTGKTAVVPLDISNGDALQVEAAGDSLVAHIRKGGFVMIPLLLIGLISIVISFWKFFDLRGMRLSSPEPLEAVVIALGAGNHEQAQKEAQSLPTPLSSLVNDALQYRNSPREHLEEILHERILSMMPKLEQYLGTLAVLGGVAPLLGLLGTVTGMIHTFDLVTIFGTGEARLLSGGISEALITTKFGLGIAIPVLLVHAFYARRIRSVIVELENTAIRFVNVLKIEKQNH